MRTEYVVPSKAFTTASRSSDSPPLQVTVAVLAAKSTSTFSTVGSFSRIARTLCAQPDGQVMPATPTT